VWRKLMSKPEYAFFGGTIVPIDQAKVSVMTNSFNYGTGVFAGMRAYWNDEQQQMFIFRDTDHFERFRQSASLLRINVPYSEAELTDTLSSLLRTEDYHENVSIRPLAYKSTEGIGARLDGLDDAVTIFAQPATGYYEDEKGIHLGFSAWRRVEDNAIPARGKIVGAYANSALIKTDAVLAGFDDALVLTEDGHVAEASTANIFMIRRGIAVTPSITSNVLEGIVRRSVIELLRNELGIEVVERPIDRTETYLAEEMFLCGTGAQVTSATQIDHRPIGTGKVGDITRQLRNLFFDVVAGRVPKYRDWLTPVYVPEQMGK
jgi:branched-chain amino acid aminotransferase